MTRFLRPSVLIPLLLGGLLLAQESALRHPDFPLLDAEGRNVLASGAAVSPMTTCAGCHDTEYIASHSGHADLGATALHPPGDSPSGREWDLGPGTFGRWNPLDYRYLTPPGDSRFDLGRADWIRRFGERHAGGGPAVTGRDGRRLDRIRAPKAPSPETHIADGDGNVMPWNWNVSGVVELNCFLCHSPAPDNAGRIAALREGRFGWAATATLTGSGAVRESGDGWRYNRDAFDGEGRLRGAASQMQSPTDAHCGQCHAVVHDGPEPLTGLATCDTALGMTGRTGEVFSAQRLFDSGMNLAGKPDLNRPWDVHAERLVACVDCHYSVNNPVYYREAPESRPAHLTFDARRMPIRDYLYRPNHVLANGGGDAETGRAHASARQCASCHSTEAGHDWLPYAERHFDRLSCESCHIPRLFAPARQAVDWTVPGVNGEARSECRGSDPGDDAGSPVLITGYEPVLLAREEGDGTRRLAPFNLITAWYWTHGDPERPVRLVDLQKALLDGGTYHASVLALLDGDGDGRLSKGERVLDTPEKVAGIAARLEAIGLRNPAIRGEVETHAIAHGVANFDWVTRDCITCHGEASRIYQPIRLSEQAPAGVTPVFVGDAAGDPQGATSAAGGGWRYTPGEELKGMYVLGHDRVDWINRTGLVLFLLVLTGIAVHGGLRIVTAMRAPALPAPPSESVYMYHFYERFWHWLQAIAITILIVTGIIIHAPDAYGLLPYQVTVRVHNIVGFILLINALFSLFYHVAGGGIREYLPEPRGFFSQAIEQTLYYLKGIFSHEAHPFEKRPGKKLNPLQKMTYLMILNLLLPLQIVTGILIWGAQRWPDISGALGGLDVLVPVHSLAAWLFAAFLILHMYLTTTGHSPLANIRAMVVGWDRVASPASNRETSS